MYLDRFFADLPEARQCVHCRGGSLDLELQMAFQPVVDAVERNVYAYEALVRGPGGEGAGELLRAVSPAQLYLFDQTCRVLAIDTAARLGLRERLSLNFFPNAMYEASSCIRLTLAAAGKVGMPVGQLVFELSEAERIDNPDHAMSILREYRKQGFNTAIDDFGAGYAGLSLLASFQPDVVKVDRALVAGIATAPAQRAIVVGVLSMCAALGCRVVAEGVEDVRDYALLRELGVRLFQGHLFSRPAIGALPEPDWHAFG